MIQRQEAKMLANPISKAIETSRYAEVLSPTCCAEKIADARVCVRPGILPAIVTVAPNSPMARVNPRIAAASRPREASGKV